MFFYHSGRFSDIVSFLSPFYLPSLCGITNTHKLEPHNLSGSYSFVLSAALWVFSDLFFHYPVFSEELVAFTLLFTSSTEVNFKAVLFIYGSSMCPFFQSILRFPISSFVSITIQNIFFYSLNFMFLLFEMLSVLIQFVLASDIAHGLFPCYTDKKFSS